LWGICSQVVASIQFFLKKMKIRKKIWFCSWQVLGLFFAFVLRAVSANARRDYDSDEDYLPARSAPRQPAGNRQANQANPPSAPGANFEEGSISKRALRNDAWSTRMREKVHISLS